MTNVLSFSPRIVTKEFNVANENEDVIMVEDENEQDVITVALGYNFKGYTLNY